MVISWIDAVDRKDINLNDILKNPTKKYLINRKLHGKIIKEDNDGIIVLIDIDEDENCEIVAIPKKWVKTRRMTNGQNKHNNKQIKTVPRVNKL